MPKKNDDIVVNLRLGTKDFLGELNQIEDLVNKVISKEVNIDVSNESLKEIEHLKEDIKGLKSDIDRVDKGKIGRTKFENFAKDTNSKIDSIRQRLDGLQDVLATTITQLGQLGTDIDLSKPMAAFDNFTDSIKSCNTAIDEILKSKQIKGDVLVDLNGINKIEEAATDLQKALTETQKLAKSVEYDSIYKDLTDKEVVNKMREFRTEYGNILAEVSNSKKILDDAPADNNIVETANYQKKLLELQQIATKIVALKEEMEIRDDNFSWGNLSKVIDHASSMTDSLTEDFASTQLTIEKIISDSETRLKEYNNTIENSSKVAEKITQTYGSAQKLADLLRDNAIYIEVKPQADDIAEKLNATVDKIQEALNKKALEVPVKVVIASASKNSKDPLKMPESAIKEAQKSGDSVFVNTSKLIGKSFGDALTSAVSLANKAFGEIRRTVEGIFKAPIPVTFEPDKTSLEKVKEEMSQSVQGGKFDIADNLKQATDAANVLKEALAEVLGLTSDIKAKSAIKTDYGSGKSTASLEQKISQYKDDINAILSRVQTEIVDQRPIWIKLDIKESEFASLKGKIENNLKPENLDLTSSLKESDEIAKKIANTLKILDGFQATITGVGSSVDLTATNEQIGRAVGQLRAIMEYLDSIRGYLLNIQNTDIADNLKDDTKQISVDFTSIIDKIQELIDVSKALVEDLRLDFSVAESSIRNLGSTLSNVISEASNNTLDSKWLNIANAFKEVAGEADNIDLRKSKNQVETLLTLYREYKDAGGLNTLSMLTDKTNILDKIQKISDKSNQELSVYGNEEKVKALSGNLNTLDTTLSSIISSLSGLNSIPNLSKIFDSIAIKKETLESLKLLPDQLKQIAEKIKELDDVPGNNFVNELKEITAQADGLKALAQVLKSSKDQIKAAVEISRKEPNDAYKDLITQLDSIKSVEKEFNKYSKKGTFETSQPKEYAEVLEIIRDRLTEINEIREFHKNDKKTEDATIGQIYDARKVERIRDDIIDLYNWLDTIKAETKELNSQFQIELKSTDKFAKSFEKIVDSGATNSKKYSEDYVDVLRQIEKELDKVSRYKGINVATEDDIRDIQLINSNLELLFRTISSIETYSNDSARNLASDMADALKEAKKYESQFYSSWGYGSIEHNYTSEYQTHLTQIEDKIKEIQSIKDKGFYTEADVKRVKELNELLQEEYKQLVQVEQVAKETSITNLQDKMSKYIEKNTRLSSGMVSQLTGYIQELDNTSEITTNRVNEIATAFNRVRYSAKLAGKEGTGFLDAIRNKLKYGWAQSIAMFFSFYDIVRYAKEISSVVVELNSNLIELSKVSDSSISNLYAQFSDFADIAKETGGTINDIIQATSNWARNGYNLQDSKELARLSSIFQNIGDGMTANQSNEYLVSTLKGFDLEAKDAIVILDTLNNVANNSASSVADIGEALERSSSAFGAANTNLTESVALLVKANEVLQNPENVGTAFKSMSARLRAANTEIESLEDGFTMTTSKLRELVLALTGFDIQDTEDSYKSIYDILLGIGKEWENLTDLQQASLSEELFGKRNSQVGFAILNNIERLEEIYALAKDSEGSALEEHEKYLEGVQYQLDRFVASTEQLANDFMSSDFLKGAIASARTLVEITDQLIKNLGSIPTIIGAIAAAIGTKHNPLFNLLQGEGMGGKFTLPLTTKTDLTSLAASESNVAIKTLIKEFNALGTQESKTALSVEEFTARVSEGNQALGLYLSNLKDGSKASFGAYQAQVAATTVKTVALRVATMALQGALFAFLGYIVQKGFEALDGVIHRTEKIIEAGEEARQKIEEINNAFKEQTDLISEYRERYATLSQGVNQGTGTNISLNSEDYAEFLEISNKLAEAFPALTRIYDENGNAILQLSGDVDEVSNSLSNLLSEEEEISKREILRHLPEAFEGAAMSVKEEYDSSIQEMQESIETLGIRIQETKNQLEQNGAFTLLKEDDVSSFRRKLRDLGIAYEEVFDKDYGDTQFSIIDFENVLTPEMIDEIIEVFDTDLTHLQSKLDKTIQDKNKALSNALSSSIAEWIYSPDDNYRLLSKASDDLLKNLQGIIDNIDFDSLDIDENWDSFTGYVQNNLFKLIEENEGLSKEFDIAFNLKTEFNNNEISVGEYNEQLQAFISLLKKLGVESEVLDAITVTLGIELDENDNVINTLQNNFKEQLDNSGIDDEFSKYLSDNLTKGELEALYNSKTNWRAILDVDGYKKAVDEMTEYQKQGNIDLFNRPLVSGQKMIEAGWTTEEYGMDAQSIATVFSSAFDILDSEGHKAIVHVTPILPDGSVLSPQELESYVYESLNGANDILATDSKGIILNVDTDVDTDEYGEVSEAAWEAADAWDIALHEVQEKVLLEGELTKEQALNIIKDYVNQVGDISFNLEYDKEQVEEATKGISKLQGVFQTLYENKQAGKTGSDLALLMTDLEDLREAVKKGEVALDISDEAWNEFFDTMTDGSHSFEEMQAALNGILTEYVNNTIELKNFDSAQADAISTQLQLAGVTKESADAYVHSMVEIADAAQIAADEGIELADITADDIDWLVQEELISEDTAEKLALYALKKEVANGITISTSADCNNLLALANAAGVATGAIETLNSLMSKYENLSYRQMNATTAKARADLGNERLALEGEIAQAKKDIQSEILNFKAPKLDFDSTKTKNKSGGGGGSKSEEDQWKKAYEKELKALDNLHDRELITDIEYYNEKDRLNEKYFANSEKYAEDYQKNQVDIYKGLKAAYQTYIDDNLDYYKKSLDAGIMSLQEYSTKAKGMLEDLFAQGKISSQTYNEKMADVIGEVLNQYDMAINSVKRNIDKQIKELEKEKKALSKDYENRKKVIQSQIDEVQKLIDARNDEIESINDVIDGKNKQIKALNKEIKAKNKQIDAVNKEIKAKNKQIEELNAQVKVKNKEIDSINKEIKVRNKIIDGFQKQIDVIQDEIDVYQKEIDKLNEANKERQAAIEYQKALYELERAQNQRTSLVYNSEKGFVYEANDQDVKAAQEQLENLKHEQAVAVLEKKISNLQESIDVLNEKIESVQDEIDGLNDRIEVLQDDIEILNERIEAIQDEIDELNKIIEAWQEEIDAINERIEALQDEIELLDEQIEGLEGEIENLEEVIDGFEDKINELETELDGLVAKIDEQITKCEEYKEAWGEVTNKFKESQEDMAASALWGSNYINDIRNQDMQLLATATQDYINLQKDQVNAIQAAAADKARAYAEMEKALNSWKAAQAAAEQTSGNYSTSSSNSVSGMKASEVTGGAIKTPTKTPTKTVPTSSAANKAKSASAAINNAYAIKNNQLARHYSYGVGTKDAEEGIHEVAETGDEIIRDNYGNAYLAEGHQLHRFEGGERVYNPTETQELLKGKYVPIDSLIPNYADMVAKMMSSNIPSFGNVSNLNVPGYKGIPSSTTDKSISVTIGDIHVTEVDNAKQLATAITNNLPTALLQELTRK